jgi:hypothetical protein
MTVLHRQNYLIFSSIYLFHASSHTKNLQYMNFHSPIYINRNLMVYHFHIVQYKCLH